MEEEKSKTKKLEKEKHEISPTGAFFLICLFLIGICVVARMVYYYIHYEPTRNYNSQEIYTIKGEFPFDKGYNLQLDVDYITSNDECSDHSLNPLFNPSPIRVTHPLEVVQTGENTFVASFAKDYYAPGDCKWRYAGVGYNISGGKHNLPTGGMSGLGGFPVDDGRTELLCDVSYSDIIKGYGYYCGHGIYFGVRTTNREASIRFTIKEK